MVSFLDSLPLARNDRRSTRLALGFPQRSQDPRLQRLRQVDLAKLLANAPQHARLEVELARTTRAGVQVLVYERHLLRRKLAVQVIVETSERFLAGIAIEVRHVSPSRCVSSVTTPDSSARYHSAFCSIFRPRCKRERTVPTGTSR